MTLGRQGPDGNLSENNLATSLCSPVQTPNIPLPSYSLFPIYSCILCSELVFVFQLITLQPRIFHGRQVCGERAREEKFSELSSGTPSSLNLSPGGLLDQAGPQALGAPCFRTPTPALVAMRDLGEPRKHWAPTGQFSVVH